MLKHYFYFISFVKKNPQTNLVKIYKYLAYTKFYTTLKSFKMLIKMNMINVGSYLPIPILSSKMCNWHRFCAEQFSQKSNYECIRL